MDFLWSSPRRWTSRAARTKAVDCYDAGAAVHLYVRDPKKSRIHEPQCHGRRREGMIRVVEEQLARVWENLAGRLSGPLYFRFVLQPIVVTLVAIRAGLRDARGGQRLYFWAILTDPARRNERIREGWRDLTRFAVVILVVDYIYQVLVFRWLYPSEGLLVGVAVALVPYVLVRGLANRVGRRWIRRAGASA